MPLQLKVRVLVLAHGFPNACDPIGGIFVLEQLKALRKLGINSFVVSPTPWPPPLFRTMPRVRKFLSIPRKTELEGFKVEHPPVLTPPSGMFFSLAGIIFYLRCRPIVRRYVAEEKIDLIHAHTVLPDGFAAVLLGREFKVPVICTAHGSDIKIYPHRTPAIGCATKWALRRVRYLVTVSHDLKRHIFRLIGPHPVEVIFNGADADVFKAVPATEARSRLQVPLDKKVVLFVGNLFPVKGVEFLLQAFSKLERSDTILYLVGEGHLRRSLTAMAEQLGIREKCMFAGKRPHHEIPLWLSAADCLVLPSLSEGLPTIVPEAMMCRVPVIATAVGGTPEIVRNEDTGLLVEPMDPIALTKNINRILDDKEFSAAIVERAELVAKSTLTWEANAVKMNAIYQMALGKL